jgi:hypothetical protein
MTQNTGTVSGIQLNGGCCRRESNPHGLAALGSQPSESAIPPRSHGTDGRGCNGTGHGLNVFPLLLGYVGVNTENDK